MNFDVAIVGAGMAGLTSAAYLCSYGYKVVVCEKQGKAGGLVNSFNKDGFVLDGGIRAIENSGIIMPMLKQLGIDIAFAQNDVCLIVEKHKLLLSKKDFLKDYQLFMEKLFPQEKPAINKLVRQIDLSMQYMKVLYGFDNPLFTNIKEDLVYALSLIPWLCKYMATIGKINALSQPIDEFLKKIGCSNELVDMFSQHFFYKTPAFFALSYFSLYLDYRYPIGGTGALPDKMCQFIKDNGGEVRLNWQVKKVNCKNGSITNTKAQQIFYKKMVWAADVKQLYSSIEYSNLENGKLKTSLLRHKEMLANKAGSNSILTVYIRLNVPAKELFKYINAHNFYTPRPDGLSCRKLKQKAQKVFSKEKLVGTKEDFFAWLELYLQANTFEISCPAMRQPSLAPKGQSALIVSCLFDYSTAEQVYSKGYYQEFKDFCQNKVCQIIFESLLAEVKHSKLECFSSTPLTIKRYTGNTGGSVTGWGFGNKPVPALTKMSKIGQSTKSLVPNVFMAGQWTFAPSGLPIAVLTGKLAADQIKARLPKKPKGKFY